MPLDPEYVSEIREWVQKAHDDLRMAKLAADVSPPLRGQAVYHAQQAAEKAMKAFLTLHDCVFRKTHNLEELGRLCVKQDAGLVDLAGRAEGLTRYVWEFRYPGERSEPTITETAAAMALATELFQAIILRLPQEAHP